MKKLITFSLITSIVVIMSNCSPKTAGKVAKDNSKSESPREQKKEPAATSPNATGGNEDVVKLVQGNRSNEEQVALLSQVNSGRLEHGKQLYESNCGKCHDLHNPNSRTAAGWVEIMKSMGPKAQLEQGNYLMISAYLIKNAKG